MQAEIEIPKWARQIVSDQTDMDRDPHPVDSTRVSSFRIELPDDVYFEYAFIDSEGEMRADPANPLRASNPWYPEVSAIEGPDYRPSRYADLPEGTAGGSQDRHRVQSEALGGFRRVTVYTPESTAGAELPLVLVHDGVAFQRLAGLHRVLEALLDEGRVRPARLAFIEPEERNRDYGFDPAYREFTVAELVPYLEERYPSSERLAMGASLGGLMSATLGLLHPDLFGTVVTFSGAFLGGPDERDFYRARESWVLERLRTRERLPLRWYGEVGTIEWLTEVNREVAGVLAEKGYDHRFSERHAGHNWVNWRNGLAPALEFALRP